MYLKDKTLNKRYSIFPIIHNDLWERYKQAEKQTWVAEETDLSKDKFDELKDNEKKMRKDMLEDGIEMLERAGVKNVKGHDGDGTPGRGIHEMGTARMGKDPKTSVLNGFNQVWDAPNVFVTDGSFMTSANCVNPSLTYMAFTARAVDHAVSELKKGNL